VTLAVGADPKNPAPPSDDGCWVVPLAPAPRLEAVELVALVREAVTAGVARQALLLRLSALRRGRHAPRRRLLREALAPLRRHPRIRVCDLPNGDVVALGALHAPPLETAHHVLRAMLDEAPRASLLRLHRLPEEAAAVLTAVEEGLGLSAAAPGAMNAGHRAATAATGARRPLDGAALAAAERALAMVDLAPFLRRQTVCRIAPEPGAAPEPLWEERRVSLPEVAAALLPRTDLAAAPRLAHRLRRALDRRLLTELARPEELRDLRRPLLLPLTLDSVTAEAFLRFDALFPSDLRAAGGLAVALPAEDALRDPAGYSFARDFLRLRGHRVVLDLPDLALAALLPAPRARFDLLRLTGGAPPPTAEREAARLRPGPALPLELGQVVLAGVERPSTIAWGWEMGITLFQGRLIERRRIGR
jgi:hypothetical protein